MAIKLFYVLIKKDFWGLSYTSENSLCVYWILSVESKNAYQREDALLFASRERALYHWVQPGWAAALAVCFLMTAIPRSSCERADLCDLTLVQSHSRHINPIGYAVHLLRTWSLGHMSGTLRLDPVTLSVPGPRVSFQPWPVTSQLCAAGPGRGPARV